MGMPLVAPLTRRRLLQISVGLPAAALAACAAPMPSGSPLLSVSPTRSPSPEPTAPPSATPTPTPTPSPTPVPVTGASRVLYRDGALTDARSPQLQVGVSILVENGVITWIRPSDAEEDPGDAAIVDASGATFVPGMVDCHSHVTGPGGARWIERFGDPPAMIVDAAEHNGALAHAAGIRWLRDVGSPIGVDPVDGRERALSLGVRDRWVGRRDRPYIRAAGSWLSRMGTLSARPSVEVSNGDELLAAAMRQLDDGADLIKLYLQGSDVSVSPFSANEVALVVEAAHARGAKVTAHAAQLAGARAGVDGGVDSIEHGFELDGTLAADMAALGIYLVSTLAILRSWISFGFTTTIPTFAAPENLAFHQSRLEGAGASVAIARAAGVAICTGSDFGGGSLRANQLAWEVESLVAAGLEPWEALAAATWRGGELLGEAEAGIIREGGPADFFLIHGDPLSDPAALWRVWRVA